MRVAGLTPFLTFLARSGPPLDGLVARANLPVRLLDHPESVIPVHQAIAFMEDAATARGMDDLGLRAGAETTLEGLGMFGRLIGASETLGGALDALARLGPEFDSGGRWWTVHERRRTWLCHQVTAAAQAYRQADQYWLGMALSLLRAAAGRRWRPDEIRVQTSAPRDFDRPDVVADTRITFSHAETAIAFPTSLARRPLARRLPTAPAPDRRDVEHWHATAPAGEFLESIEQVIATLSSPDYPRIDVVARAIGTGVRTLQRRLAEAGASYERLLARARFGTAAHLLASTDATVLDIALDVGYSDHAHFTRAFRRWTGLPPREFRKHRRANGLAWMLLRP